MRVVTHEGKEGGSGLANDGGGRRRREREGGREEGGKDSVSERVSLRKGRKKRKCK